MTPQDLTNYEQASATLADLHAPVIRRVFTNLVTEGFTEQQALELTKTWMAMILKPQLE